MPGPAQFTIDGHRCFIVPEGAPLAHKDTRIVGSVTLGESRYSICSRQLDPKRATPVDLLTARELQIAVLSAQGLDDKAVGRRLGISPLTVGTHLARVYAKLGVSSRSALAARIAGTVALHRRPADPTLSADQALPST